MKKLKRHKRLHTMDQMRSALRRKIQATGMSQAAFAEQYLRENPAILSMVLNGKRGLSKPQRALLGVKREIMYRQQESK